MEPLIKGNVAHVFLPRDFLDDLAVLLKAQVELALNRVGRLRVLSHLRQRGKRDRGRRFFLEPTHDRLQILSIPFGRWVARQVLPTAKNASDVLENERHDVVVPKNDDHLIGMTGHHASESLERAVGKVAANAEVRETKLLVLWPLLQFADPVKAPLCCGDTGAETGDHHRFRSRLSCAHIPGCSFLSLAPKPAWSARAARHFPQETRS